METYEKARDIFDYISKYHREIKKMFKEEKEEVNRRRVRMLLDYLARHEQRFENSMGEASRNNGGSLKRRNVLQNWQQYVPNHEKLSTGDIRLNPDMSLDEVTEAALELDDRLVSYISYMAENPSIPEQLQEIFRKMMRQEIQEKRDLKKTAEQIKGL